MKAVCFIKDNRFERGLKNTIEKSWTKGEHVQLSQRKFNFVETFILSVFQPLSRASDETGAMPFPPFCKTVSLFSKPLVMNYDC